MSLPLKEVFFVLGRLEMVCDSILEIARKGFVEVKDMASV